MFTMENVRLETVVIEDLFNRDYVLSALESFFDEDFCGNNGEEFTREVALEQGFKSTQDYVLDVLKNSGLCGEELITAYFEQWIGQDGYYLGYSYELTQITQKTYVLSVVIVEDDN